MIKYLVLPSFVTSKSDGQTHFIKADALMQLYGVHHSECMIFDENATYSTDQLKFNKELLARKDLIQLRPRYDGNYTLPGTIRAK